MIPDSLYGNKSEGKDHEIQTMLLFFHLIYW